MKLNPAFPLVLFLTVPAWGQHASAGGGHVGGASSSGRSFSMSSPRSFGSAPAHRSNLSSPRGSYSSPIGPPPFGGTQPITGRRYPGNGYGYGYPYSRAVYAVPGFLNYGFYGYPDDSYYGDQQQPASEGYPDASAAAAPSAAGPADAGYPQAYAVQPGPYPYQAQNAPPAIMAPQPSAPVNLPDQPAVTLYFKDGRAPEQVQNYALTQTTLYVLNGSRRREIPLDAIDLPQTEKVNREAGVDFDVPAGVE